MAVHALSTTAPAVQAGLLPRRDARGRFVKLASELPPGPLLPAAPDTLDAIRADLDALVATCGRMSTGPVPANDTPSSPRGGAPICATVAQTRDALVARGADISTAWPETLVASRTDIGTSAAARTLHFRRQLAQAAEHGAALLASLGLPRLVRPDFVPLDPAAIGDAVDAAVAALDALDGDVEAEAVNEDGDDLDDGEMEEGDREPWLAAAEGAQHYRGGDLDLEQDGEIERPWWGPQPAGLNRDEAFA